MVNILSKSFTAVLVAVLAVQFSGCGTILYPERRGQKAGHIDVGVALLDAIGLLFFLIPGIIAFAVDFSNGTIYLPPSVVKVTGKNELRQIKFDPNTTNMAQLEAIIERETGHKVKLDDSAVQTTRLKSKEDMMVRFAQTDFERTEHLALLTR